MKLIDLLVQELPNRGGWPEGVNRLNHAHDGEVEIYRDDGDSYSLPKKLRLPLTENHRLEGYFVSESSADFVTRQQYEAALAASKQHEWDGEGLPPVGARCEWQDKNTKAWIPMVVVYSSEWVTVIKEDKEVDPVELAIENYADEARCKFRPIRTEAERKREEAGLAIYNAINWNAEGELASPVRMEDYRKAYDAIAAGKIPGIKLAD